jgi:hypothetical protein
MNPFFIADCEIADCGIADCEIADCEIAVQNPFFFSASPAFKTFSGISTAKN